MQYKRTLSVLKNKKTVLEENKRAASESNNSLELFTTFLFRIQILSSDWEILVYSKMYNLSSMQNWHHLDPALKTNAFLYIFHSTFNSHKCL